MPKHPGKKQVAAKIKKLKREGKSQKRAVAQALNTKRKRK